MEQLQNQCHEQCKFQRDGKCTLERVDQLAPIHGATCCEHIFEEESKTHY
jgi:hypothetical protein